MDPRALELKLLSLILSQCDRWVSWRVLSVRLYCAGVTSLLSRVPSSLGYAQRLTIVARVFTIRLGYAILGLAFNRGSFDIILPAALICLYCAGGWFRLLE
jgi:hypothetical protein